MIDVDKLIYKPGILAGQKILVTGGGTGLGKSMAEAFLFLGAEVVIFGRRKEVLQAAADDMMSRHAGSVVPIVCDIRDPVEINQAIDLVWNDGPLDGLVNNAAGNFISRTEDLSTRAFDAVSRTSSQGAFYLTLDIAKRWIADGRRGNVISVLASWISSGSPFIVPMAMAKAGLEAMTRSLAVEWGRYGLRFNALAPGLFPTEGMTARMDPDGDGPLNAKSNPLGRTGEMHELCNVATFLMAPGLDYLNGVTITIDGAEQLAHGPSLYGLTSKDDAWWAAARSATKGK